MALTEADIISRHIYALKDAHEACRRLGLNADPDHLERRGRWYTELKAAAEILEGSCRQLAHWRSDARWLKLGIIYGRIARDMQPKYVGQRWAWFNKLLPLFAHGMASMQQLKDMRTGMPSSTPILPNRASEWLSLPAFTPLTKPPGITVH